MFDNRDTIHKYTRTQALADGVLIDASSLAWEAGFRFPVALTRAAWEKCVAVPPGVTCQDETGRLWDVLHMLYAAIRHGECGPVLSFAVHVRNDNRPRIPPAVRLKAICGPADDGSPCITVLLPDED